MSRKPRSDAFWQKLSHAQQDQLSSWLLDEGLSYGAAAERLHMDWGVQTSETAIGGFWERVCAPRQFARVAEASEAAPALTGGLGSNFEATSEAYVRQHYFVLLASRHPDPKLLATFAVQVAALDHGRLEREKLRFNRQKTAIAERRKRRELRFSIEKFENQKFKVAEQTKKLRETGTAITEEERLRIVAEIDRAMGII